MTIETKNAVIESAKFFVDRGLTATLMMDYGDGGHQGFGNYMLYAPKDWSAHGKCFDACGHFIYRCLEVAGAEDWAKLPGRTVRVRADLGRIYAIGHIVKDDWFDPEAEFKALRAVLQPGETD